MNPADLAERLRALSMDDANRFIGWMAEAVANEPAVATEVSKFLDAIECRQVEMPRD